MVRNIIFDFGGVLVDWDPRYFYCTVFADEAEMEHFLTTVCTPEWNARHDLGGTYAENIEILQAMHSGYRREIGLSRSGWSHMLRGEIPGSVALLHELAGNGYDIYGLTNWSAETIGEAFERFPFFYRH